MNQSTMIAGTLIAGFFLFLAAKNRLTVYTGVLWGPTSEATPGTGGSQVGGGDGKGGLDHDAGAAAGAAAGNAILPGVGGFIGGQVGGWAGDAAGDLFGL